MKGVKEEPVIQLQWRIGFLGIPLDGGTYAAAVFLGFGC